jgi:N-formylglutamate amidohydrolase
MTIDTAAWRLEEGDGPLIATAIHNGHEVRPELLDRFALSEADRLREEDPFTGRWTVVAPTSVIGLRSRFEVDLNRPREQAVYRVPADAWGLDVWKAPLPDDEVERSLEVYDAFRQTVHELLDSKVRRHGRVVVLDLHSYNHRRGGPTAEPANPRENPEVNVGTGTMNRDHWAPIVDRFLADLRATDFLGRRLDVRENVKFRGGYFPTWIHQAFPESVCVLSVEFKKFFMDEWTGQADQTQLAAITVALESTVAGIHEILGRLGESDRESSA